MELKFLGTGTSTGVPQIGCQCEVCKSTNSKDMRLRASALLSINTTNILIDSGPDFRAQMLDNNSPHLDALLITHSHYDHTGGIDDLRPYCKNGKDFPIYCKDDVAYDLKNRVPYCFVKHPYPGVPSFDIHIINPDEPFYIGDIEITPLPVMHYKLPILGFKINNLAYITDARAISDKTINLLKGIDTLVINALRHEEHLSHFNLEQPLEVIGIVNPRISYLTHLCHQMGFHDEEERKLPQNVKIAYDGLAISI